MPIDALVDELDAALPQLPWARPGGSLLMMVGLPGVGKSSIVKTLQNHLPCLLVATDDVRARFRQSPTYTTAEVKQIYDVCYALIERRLRRGQRVVFDGSNHLAARRDYLARLAWRNGAPVAICVVQAAQEVIQQRLRCRNSYATAVQDKSDADWSVYQWMVEAQEPVAGEHLILDSTTTPLDDLAQTLYTYWLCSETKATSDPDLQPFSWADKLSLVDGVGG
jgi:predicted kinase